MAQIDWKRSKYDVPKMDCAAEERLVRMALESDKSVGSMEFDLAARSVTVVHRGETSPISDKLESLGLGAKLRETIAAPDAPSPAADDPRESRTLWWLLGINAGMFVLELAAGWYAESAGLIADSLDMFADAAVYGVSLYAVGRAATVKLKAARLSGWLQMLLALGAFVEVIRRFLLGSEPLPPYMVGIALMALAANVACLALISRHRTGGVHMRASFIFSTNDVIANVGVIAAGALVARTGSHLPDLVIGAIIATVVLAGAVRILRLPG